MTIDAQYFRSLLTRLGRAFLAALHVCVAFVRKTLLSARAWVMFVLLAIVVLVAYYVLSDLHTPFTTDAYVQAYVNQVAARVSKDRSCVSMSRKTRK